MKISAIVRKNSSSFEIICDEGENLVVRDEVLLEYRELFVGNELDDSTIDKIRLSNEYATAYNTAMKYIASSLRTEKEVRDRLKNYPEEIVSETVRKLIERKYLDDEYYAKCFVNTYGESKGVLRLRYELKRKGVDDGITEELLSQTDDYEKAERECEKHRRKCADRNKALRHLLARGFGYDTAKSAVNKYYSGEEDFD